MSETAKLWTLDQLLQQRAIDEDQTPLLAFPNTRQGVSEYEPITGASLNRFVDGAAKCLQRKGFPAVDQEVVVGICAPTDLDYIVNIFALIRLGYTAFQLSPRLALSAVRELLKSTQQGRYVLLYATEQTPIKPDALDDLELHPIVTREEYDNSQHRKTPEFHRELVDIINEHHRRCLILHSSGSTGLPKPIDYNHQKLMTTAIYAQDATAFITMPFSHALSMNSYMQAIHSRKTIYAMTGYTPQTHNTVTAAIKAAKPEIIWTVPYVIKLLAEKPDGIDVMKNCRFVSSGGSKLPDELGDMLTDAGVHIGMQFGSTETGLILSSAYRPREDKAWNYLRPPPHVVPYIKFNVVNGQDHECVILDGHKGKTMSNSDDPPKSWRTNDLFVPHPIIPNAWKFVGRMDDRITLLNGEKVLPLSIEGRIRNHPMVREAVVFGIDREVPGLLLFRARDTSHLKDEEFLDHTWPVIQYANSHAEGFSQISREMVAIIPENVECPSTDKSSIKRGLVYKEFASVIDATYAAAGSPNKSEALQLTILELEDWILRALKDKGYNIENATTDFFSVGIDSLQAIHLRGRILKEIDLGGHESECTSMIVYDCGNPKRLARRLHTIRTGDDVGNEQDGAISTIRTLIDKYCRIPLPARCVDSSIKSFNAKQVVVLTGATGFLGAHLLAALVASSNVRKVYAFIRPGNQDIQPPAARLERSLQSKGLDVSLKNVVPLYHDLTQTNFGLKSPALYDQLKSEVTHIIHCAWSVNFAIPLSAFEPQLLGLHNLLAFTAKSAHNVRLVFCSSIGVAQSTKVPARIASAPIPSHDHCSPTGYAQSKLVGEYIVESAVRSGANATVLRIGQIIPGRHRGTKLWNPTEAIPLTIQSASKISAGALPTMDPGRDACSWFEADTLADTILQLAGIVPSELGTESSSPKGELVYNLVNPREFSWNNDLLPALRHAGLEFDIVSWEKWLARLESSTDDLKINPSRKLLGFWSNQTPRKDRLTFDTGPAEAASSALNSAVRVVDANFIDQIVDAWKQNWHGNGNGNVKGE